jgi:hypothetical protein
MFSERILTVLLNVVFIPIWLCWRALRWFTVSVFKETGNRLVKLTAVLIVGVIITVVVQYLQGV